MNNAPSSPISKAPQSAADADASSAIHMLYGRTSALLENEHFRWFLDECLTKKIAEWQEKALDINADPETRNLAAHIRSALKEIEGWTQNNATAPAPSSSRNHLDSKPTSLIPTPP